MSLILKSNTAIPEATALNLRGIQTDPYGAVLGGHKAIFDLATLSEGVDALAVSDPVSNLVYGAEQATCNGAFTGMTAAKGVPLTTSTSDERLDLPGVFKLHDLGSEPSLLISAWITVGAAEGGAVPANTVMGHAFQSGDSHGWSLRVDGGAAMQWTLRDDNATNTLLTVDFDDNDIRAVPHLHTLELRRTASGLFTANTFLDPVKTNTQAGLAYPLATPALPASAGPARIGALPAYGAGFQGTVHRVQLLKFDPDEFIIEEWLAAEVAANGARFN